MSKPILSKQPIFLVSGSKGGVGKSLVSMCVLDLIGPVAALVETDTSNPDVAKAYEKTNQIYGLDLDEKNGWIELVNQCDGLDAPVVINGAARSAAGLAYAPLLKEALPELNRDLIVLFVMSRTRDSLELLADHRLAFPDDCASTWAVLNTFFGRVDEFTRYQNSEQRKAVEATAGTLAFPDLADRVHDQLINERMTIAQAAQEMQIGNRVELVRWRADAHAELQKVIT